MFKKISNRLKLPLTKIFGTFEDQAIQELDKIDESLTPFAEGFEIRETVLSRSGKNQSEQHGDAD